eukprot:SAG11_NODE_1385_length_5070_cov_3.950915_4_plen_125_part_00
MARKRTWMQVGARLGRRSAAEASDVNYACHPFFSLDEKLAYSVAWPIARLEPGEELVVLDASVGAAMRLRSASAAAAGVVATVAAMAMQPEFVEAAARREFQAQLNSGESEVGRNPGPEPESEA